MLATDEDAVICDFAETYHVLDIGALDLRLAATLAVGLAPDSRIKRRLSGAELPVNTLLLALAADNLAILRWFNSEDAQKNVNRPKSVLEALTGGAQKEDNVMTFTDADSFERYRAKILEGINHVD